MRRLQKEKQYKTYQKQSECTLCIILHDDDLDDDHHHIFLFSLLMNVWFLVDIHLLRVTMPLTEQRPDFLIPLSRLMFLIVFVHKQKNEDGRHFYIYEWNIPFVKWFISNHNLLFQSPHTFSKHLTFRKRFEISKPWFNIKMFITIKITSFLFTFHAVSLSPPLFVLKPLDPGGRIVSSRK